MAWQVYDAKARFSEFLDATLKDGPQILTRRGVETAVLVPIDEWKHLKNQRGIPSLTRCSTPMGRMTSIFPRAGPQAAPIRYLKTMKSHDLPSRHQCRLGIAQTSSARSRSGMEALRSDHQLAIPAA
jgi:antitoxin Phd